MTQVIINADDFGLTPNVNHAIIELFEAGALTSTTALAAADHVEAGLAALPPRFRDRVGLHLCLDEERPASDPADVPTLVDPATGRLPQRGRLVGGLVLGRVSREEIYRELKAQVDRLIDLGVRPSHFDSHGHLHAFPAVAAVVARLMDEYGVVAVRRPVESFWFPGRSPRHSKRIPVSLAISLCARRSFASSLKDKVTTAGFSGLLTSGHADVSTLASLGERLRRANLPSIEIMCHPGLVNDDGVDRYRDWGYDWRLEFEAIKSVRATLFADDRLQPAAFADLIENQSARVTGN
jgi:predicted glycoside hydrolase/deacetylase ChbG (UPF0249 family)